MRLGLGFDRHFSFVNAHHELRIDETNEDGSEKDKCQTRGHFPCKLDVVEQSWEMWKHVRRMRAARKFVAGKKR